MRVQHANLEQVPDAHHRRALLGTPLGGELVRPIKRFRQPPFARRATKQHTRQSQLAAEGAGPVPRQNEELPALLSGEVAAVGGEIELDLGVAAYMTNPPPFSGREHGIVRTSHEHRVSTSGYRYNGYSGIPAK